MPSIHPIYRGVSVNFIRGGELVTENTEYGSAEDLSFQHTPIGRLLSRGETTGRWKLAVSEGVADYPQLAELMHNGGTDHLVNLVGFPHEIALRGVALSLTSDAPEGFTDGQLGAILELLPALGLACYRMAVSKTATEILSVYTGAKTGARILAGETQRGKGGSIYATVLLADLRNFTALTEVHPPGEIVELLNEHFELIAQHVEEHSGEILKFMGDSVLAIFPADLGGPRGACLAALVAAQNMLEANNALNRERVGNGGPDIGIDVVLHLGEVYYGNIGARGRQDFTVIGRAVNEASRLEKLCSELGENLLVSESFALTCGVACEPLGSFVLRGVSEKANVFKIAISARNSRNAI
jgi:adenylate cyclase